MSGPGVWAGLAESTFLADIDARDRDPMRLLASVIGGFVVGFVAAMACWILVLVPFTIAVGRGGDVFKGVGEVALMLQDFPKGGLTFNLLRLVVATATDGTFLVAFVALAAILAKRPFLAYVTVAAKVRWRLLAAGLALSVLAMAPLIAADRLLAPDGLAIPILAISPGPVGRLAYGLSALLLIPAAAAEELLFRGWLLRQTAAFTRRPAMLVVFTALVFSALHFDFAPGALLTRALMGAGFAYMTLRLGGIEFSTGVHAANNILIVLFIEPLTLQNAGASSDLSLGALLEDVALIAGYIVITEAVVRVAPMRRWAGVRLEELARPTAAPVQVS